MIIRRLFFALVFLSLFPFCGFSQAPIGEVVRLDPALNDLLAEDAKIELLAGGFKWAEGPVWIRSKAGAPGHLLFSDIPNNRVVKWSPRGGAVTWLKPAGYTGVTDYGREPGCNGLALDAKGQLLSCEHGDRRVSVMIAGSGKRTLADAFEGKRFNSPNDLCVHSSGAIYFTDPPYGLPKRFDDERRELEFCGVYRLAVDGTVTLLTKEFDRPNGIALSPDEKTLYVAQSKPGAAYWTSFPVKGDGSLGPSKVLFDATGEPGRGLPDGLKIDKQGNLWATGPGGVWVISPTGKPLGRIDTKQATANCGWGGDDGSVLYMTADDFLMRIRTTTKGANWDR